MISRYFISYSCLAVLFVLVGVFQSWSVSLSILNLCIISAIMAIGINIQWGYAGLFNIGIVGFSALGGVAAVLVSKAPIEAAWKASYASLLTSLILTVGIVLLCYWIIKKIKDNKVRNSLLVITISVGLFVIHHYFDSATLAIESIEPSRYGYLGGLGLPILLSWVVGGFFAAGIAWLIGKITLSLRSDYLAIATLGISEIIISIIKNETWLTRGVNNVSNIPRPVPYELDLQQAPWFLDFVKSMYSHSLSLLPLSEQSVALQSFIITASSITVKLSYTLLFIVVLIIILLLSNLALKSPWGRMMRAIRDNETAASAMGKDIFSRHLQVFVIGSAIVGVAGAMLITLDGQFTPQSYRPLRFTFLIWIMVIVGGTGNNYGSILGATIIWFAWIMAEPVGVWLIDFLTQWMNESSSLRLHLLDTAQHMRLFLMGFVLIVVMRFNPKGILPEHIK